MKRVFSFWYLANLDTMDGIQDYVPSTIQIYDVPRENNLPEIFSRKPPEHFIEQANGTGIDFYFDEDNGYLFGTFDDCDDWISEHECQDCPYDQIRQSYMYWMNSE